MASLRIAHNICGTFPLAHPQFSTLTSQLVSRAYKVVPVFFFKHPYYNFQYIYIYVDINEMSFLGFIFS